MQEDIQILELSGKPKQDILKEVAQILNDHQIQRFTLLIRRKPLPHDISQDRISRLEDLLEKVGKPLRNSPIDRFHRSSFYANHRTMSIYQADSEQLQFQELLPTDPKDLALRLYRKGQWNEALELLNEVRESSQVEDCREVETMIGNCLFQLKKIQQATETYKSLLEGAAQKEKGQLFNNLGCCYGILGQQKLSMNAYSKALEIYGGFPEVDCASLLTNIANIYFGCKMHQVAQKYYQLAIQERRAKRPHLRALLYHGYYKLSLTQVQQKKFKQAEQSLERALELAQEGFGDCEQVLKQSALVKQLQGKWIQALRFYELMNSNYIEQKKGKGFIYEKVGRVYQNLGKATEHAKYIRLAQEQYKAEGNVRKLSQLSKGMPFV